MDPEDPSEPPERGAADSMVTAAHSIIEPNAAEHDVLTSTGYHKPLKAGDRAQRMVASVGLTLGQRLGTMLRDDHVLLILMAVAVGVTSGAAAGVLLSWIESANELLTGAGGSLMAVAVLLVPIAGGVVAGALQWISARYLHESPVSSPEGVIDAVVNRHGRLGGRSGVIAGLGAGFTIGSGGSVGHEGPSVAIGATVGSAMANFFGFQLRRRVAMVGAGCAAGLAAAFNAPLAGVIFTVELVFGGAIGGNVGTMSVFIPLIVAAVSGTFTSHAIFGNRAEFDLPLHSYASLPEYGFYVVLAIAAGLLGAGFGRSIVFAFARFDRLPRVPQWLKPAVGAAGVGLLAAIVTTDVLGAGHNIVDEALHGRLVWELALVLMGLKLVATSLTLGSGGFGGAFMPSLVIGSCLGTVVGTLAHLAFGASAQAHGAYALVGMGAVFAGLMQAPLTPIVMVFELTHDYAIILPLMLSCILAVVVSRRINDGGLYRLLAQRRGVVLRTEAEGEVMKRGHVSDLMRPADHVLRKNAELDEIRETVLEAGLRSAYVVDDDGRAIGYINGDQLARRMLAGEIKSGSVAGDLMATTRLTPLVPQDTLAGAMLAFARAERELLPVLGPDQRLVGVLQRSDVLSHYTDKVLGQQEEVLQVHPGASPDQEVGLGKGVVLERIVVDRRWAGKSLIELELRRRTGVVVLEWRRGDNLVAVDPRAPLREGDVLALAGSRRAILRTRELS